MGGPNVDPTPPTLPKKKIGAPKLLKKKIGAAAAKGKAKAKATARLAQPLKGSPSLTPKGKAKAKAKATAKAKALKAKAKAKAKAKTKLTAAVVPASATYPPLDKSEVAGRSRNVFACMHDNRAKRWGFTMGQKKEIVRKAGAFWDKHA